jgi:large subunit ribosomal protein L25
MKEITLPAKKRELSTKGAVNQLRRDKCVPGIFYIKGSSPISISVHENALRPFVYTADTHLAKLEIEEVGSYQAILKDIQFDPVSDKMIHFDLLGLNADDTIEIQVPILFTGQPVGIKDGGVIQQHLHKIDIECLPKFIPDHIVIDISELKVGGSVHIRDIKLENVTIKNTGDVSIVAVTIPRAPVEPAAEAGAVEAAAEPEVISKGKAEEEEE